MVVKSSLSRPIPKVAMAFRPEYLDFRRGIHVGNLEDNERITRVLKLELEARYGEPFVTERYGRGVYWQWIGYLSRANRAAKPLSSHVSFSCSKFFLMVDTEEKLFKCGLQVERGCVKRTLRPSEFDLRSDWDWHRLMKSLHPKGTMDSELKRLVRREGFCLQVGIWSEPARFARANWPGLTRLRHLLASITPDEWAGFQLYYPMREQQVLSSKGVDLIEAIMAVFHEVTRTMNLCMQTQLPEDPCGSVSNLQR